MNTGHSSQIFETIQVTPYVAEVAGGLATAPVGLNEALCEFGVNSRILTTTVTAPKSHRQNVIGDNNLESSAVVNSNRVSIYPVRQPVRLAYAPALRNELRRIAGTIDLIHIHSLFLYPQFIAQNTARKNQIPYVVSIHGALDPFLQANGRFRKKITELLWQRKMLSCAAAIHVTSEQEAVVVDALDFGAPIQVIPLGVDTSRFEAAITQNDSARRSRADRDGPVIITHGRITAKKGLDIAIRSFPLVHQRFPNASLKIVGPDDEGLQLSLEHIAVECNIDRFVHFVGPMVGDMLAATVSEADVWILPSHTENFGIAPIEAMAAGVPVVLSRHINIAQNAENAHAAVVCDNTPESFAASIMSILDDDGLRRSLVEGAVEFAARNSWASVVDQYLDMYRDCIVRSTDSGQRSHSKSWE